MGMTAREGRSRSKPRSMLIVFGLFILLGLLAPQRCWAESTGKGGDFTGTGRGKVRAAGEMRGAGMASYLEEYKPKGGDREFVVADNKLVDNFMRFWGYPFGYSYHRQYPFGRKIDDVIEIASAPNPTFFPTTADWAPEPLTDIQAAAYPEPPTMTVPKLEFFAKFLPPTKNKPFRIPEDQPPTDS